MSVICKGAVESAKLRGGVFNMTRFTHNPN